ncbi:hypothetical protein FRX31_023802 [Thalictrum thalictroides]|uniref:Uncharacterized protein n=1 Tax=Thalictrum thalictroides TaxID=46969 RepID=A0A7J6VQH6_THATH|nr:hypothetical protein FRX31_023802 [Thalictrum thalictroides]
MTNLIQFGECFARFLLYTLFSYRNQDWLTAPMHSIETILTDQRLDTPYSITANKFQTDMGEERNV